LGVFPIDAFALPSFFFFLQGAWKKPIPNFSDALYFSLGFFKTSVISS